MIFGRLTAACVWLLISAPLCYASRGRIIDATTGTGVAGAAIAVEAARAGFDEIPFDYLRFPDAPRGIGFAKPTTEASRLEAIAGFLAEARQQLAPFNVA